MRAAALILAFAGVLAVDTPTQCVVQWMAGRGASATDRPVDIVIPWDPDGPGPAAPQIAIGGQFSRAGNAIASQAAGYDPATGAWKELGNVNPFGPPLPAPEDAVLAFASRPDGELLVSTRFYNPANATNTWGIRRRTGAAWQWFATSDQPVFAILSLPNGDVIAGGTFSMIDWSPANNIARCHNGSWTPLGSGMNGGVNALAVLPNGDFIAAGSFTTAGGGAANRIARWDGNSWSPLQSGLNGTANALLVDGAGTLWAGGAFTTAGGVATARIARWDGANWLQIPSGPNNAVRCLASGLGGDVLVGGNFTTVAGVAANYVARWSNGAWSTLGAGVSVGLDSPSPSVNGLAVLPNGDVLAGGNFRKAGSAPSCGLARWDGTSWQLTNAGTDWAPGRLFALRNGDIVADGPFEIIDGVLAHGLARWDGTTWWPIGGGVTGNVGPVVELPNGDLVIGGSFLDAGGVAANRVVRWDGSAMHPMGAGLTTEVRALTVLPGGDVLAGCIVGTFRWDGTTWQTLPGSPDAVMALMVVDNGDVIAGGDFNQVNGAPAGHLARWNGMAWQPWTAGFDGDVRSLGRTSSGDIVAAGWFLQSLDPTPVLASGIARWNGTAWQAMPGLGYGVSALTSLPNGDLVAGKANGTTTAVMRWNGATWQSVAGGLDAGVSSVVMSSRGHLFACGFFRRAGHVPSSFVARLDPTCPAVAANSSAGCPSSGGANSLSATALPWIGSTFRSRATGLPGLGFVVAVTGFTAISAPLATLFAQGQPGCVLATAPDVTAVVLPVAGSVTFDLSLPNAPALAGIPLQHQMVPFELDAAGGLVSVTVTNALGLTIGSL